MNRAKYRKTGLRAVAAAMAISAPLLLGLAPAEAADEGSGGEFPEDVRGMVILKLPFGGSSIFSSPRMGFDFQVQKRSEYDYLKEKHDPETGRRLPEVEVDRVRTWPLERPVFELPDESENERKSPPDAKPFGPPRLG